MNPRHSLLVLICMGVLLPAQEIQFRRVSPAELSDRVKSFPPEIPSPLLGKPLSPFSLTGQNGRRWTHADLPGKRTVIAVWALWCPPCIAELPQLQAAFLRAKPRTDVQLLTLNLDENPNDFTAFLKKARYTFPSLLEAGAFHKQIHAGAKDVSIPRFFLVNEKGIVAKEISGLEGLSILAHVGLVSPATQPAAISR